MLKIDAHQHFWKYRADRDSWITEEMSILRQDFMPEALLPLLEQHGFDGSVVVQADQSDEETFFQLENAVQFPFVKGVVGWTDLQDRNIEETLSKYALYPKLKGFRHILQGERDRAMMLGKAFKNGVRYLRNFGFTYDLVLFPDQLQFAENLVAEFQEQFFVLDHLGKPDIKNQEIKDWSRGIFALAKHDHVYCKASGLVTEADLANWKATDFIPYLEVIFEAFGVERVMYGSDWPVCRLAATYGQVNGVMEEYISSFSTFEQALFWGGNAERFYKLS